MVRFIYLFLILFIILTGCAYLRNPLRKETHRLQRGRLQDTSSFVYDLPYPQGTSHMLVQGYFTNFTHKRFAALDFKMPVGSTICAARDGVVAALKEDSNLGGPAKKNRPKANYVIILHEDSSRANYWHLKKDGVLVNLGDSVKAGQPIAISGNTGYTYFPHLHFSVRAKNAVPRFRQIPVRFRTRVGNIYLKAIRYYQNPERKK